MKNLILVLVLVFFFIKTHGQFFKPDSAGIKYFELGVNLLKSEKYSIADSIFSLAMCSYKNENVYFNRGLARLMNKDTCGFCSDLAVASNKYNDIQAERLFHEYCCKKVDTTYFDKKMRPSNRQSYRYYDVLTEAKFTNEIIGKMHDIKANNVFYAVDYDCSWSLIGLKGKATDIIGIYSLIDTIRYYTYTETLPSIKIYNPESYKELKDNFSSFLLSKYNNLKELNHVAEITVYYMLYISKRGEITSVQYTGTFPEINFGDKRKEFEEDFIRNVNFYPAITPGMFRKEKVNFIMLDVVKF